MSRYYVHGELTGTREAARKSNALIQQAKNKLLIWREREGPQKKRRDEVQHPFIPCEKLFRRSIIISEESTT